MCTSASCSFFKEKKDKKQKTTLFITHVPCMRSKPKIWRKNTNTTHLLCSQFMICVSSSCIGRYINVNVVSLTQQQQRLYHRIYHIKMCKQSIYNRTMKWNNNTQIHANRAQWQAQKEREKVCKRKRGRESVIFFGSRFYSILVSVSTFQVYQYQIRFIFLFVALPFAHF